ncbi:MAG: energy transducer TonB [bacterium]|nr:energy transducer TonB [bacterium]
MTTLDDDNNNRLIRWVGISLALHILIIVSLSLITSKKQGDKVFYTPSYKVDLVTVSESEPVKAKKSKVSSPKKEKPVPISKKAKTVAKEKVKTSKKKSKAVEIDPSKAIESLRNKHADDSAIEEALARARARVDKETGDNINLDEASGSRPKSVKKVQNSDIDKELKGYYDNLWNKIKDSWILPGQADFSGMTVVASVIIGSDGRLLDLSIEKGSGNGFFDASTLRAIRKSAPFPPLPVGYEGGLEIGFRFALDGI